MAAMMMQLITILLVVLGVIFVSRALHLHKTLTRLPKWTALTWPFVLPSTNSTSSAKEPPLRDLKLYEFPPLRERTSSRMAMGLKRLDQYNWLTIDSNYIPEHNLRSKLCETSRP